MTPRGIQPIRRAVHVDTYVSEIELAAMPDTTAQGADGLLALEESLLLLADAAALPSERES